MSSSIMNSPVRWISLFIDDDEFIIEINEIHRTDVFIDNEFIIEINEIHRTDVFIDRLGHQIW